MNFSNVVFSTNQDLVEWEARADGVGRGQGLLVGEERRKLDDGYALKLKNPWNETTQIYGSSWRTLGRETYNSISYLVRHL